MIKVGDKVATSYGSYGYPEYGVVTALGPVEKVTEYGVRLDVDQVWCNVLLTATGTQTFEPYRLTLDWRSDGMGRIRKV